MLRIWMNSDCFDFEDEDRERLAKRCDDAAANHPTIFVGGCKLKKPRKYKKPGLTLVWQSEYGLGHRLNLTKKDIARLRAAALQEGDAEVSFGIRVMSAWADKS